MLWSPPSTGNVEIRNMPNHDHQKKMYSSKAEADRELRKDAKARAGEVGKDEFVQKIKNGKAGSWASAVCSMFKIPRRVLVPPLDGWNPFAAS